MSLNSSSNLDHGSSLWISDNDEMVLLTMTKNTVEGLRQVEDRQHILARTTHQDNNNPTKPPVENTADEPLCDNDDEKPPQKSGRTQLDGSPSTPVTDGLQLTAESTEPSLANPSVGNPISHSQVLDLSRQMRDTGSDFGRLEELLRGSKVYIPPPPPKREPTSEYKALMARLRREEELRVYERMTNPPAPMETFTQKFPASSAAFAFSSNQGSAKELEDEVTYADVDRQMALIFNVLISIVACAGGLWVVARWWSTPARLALSMGGSLLVGVAEVVVYLGYVRRVGEAKGKAKGLKEVKEIVNTWVVGGPDYGNDTMDSAVPITGNHDAEENSTRRRKIQT
ncbi:hypothetical protein GLAREA_07664 [Glarea lozoyensis ATCC 20868]|uniref:Vacuolar h+-atpase assembly protein n=1 Tax=Glarea lozoyensis (strain ATCC 20868 / MF5171) TaxID=1116229 RepID=S3D3Z3_GLAL2|nr:uncharacterized protein GLAREA_07664 [Glarea lozoyensis ATCC 20868]EPE32530.1 hypothetical protein GLAREA_07664 [Glarea lozoyensis ATCC 20868]